MSETQIRKSEHLMICLEKDVETPGTWLEDVIFVHQSLPEMSLDEIDTSINFFGKKLAMPLLIAAITGGTEEAKEINKNLAKVAQKKQIGLGLGSQRAMIEKPELKETYYVRDVAEDILLFGNIGIAQIRSFSIDQIENALESIGADGLCVHINPAQELFQKKGDYDFRKCLSSLSDLCKELKYPVIAKEVGNGISRESALKLKEAGVKAIDVGGMGGSNWILIDSLRSGKDCTNFKYWGIPTACSILEAKVGLPIIATGGIRTGLDIAKAIALGADLCGIALPFLRILKKDGVEGLEKYVDKLHEELKMAMFLTGCRNIQELKKAKYVLTGRIKNWVEARKII
ncbi:MAG: type 2 isopentenyl-diphosphate Delta-isomerase [archaeon]